MAQADDPRPIAAAGDAKTRPRPPWATGMICLTMLPLLGFIGGQGRALWSEWSGLGGDRSMARATVAIGYPGISPNPTFAERPSDWKRHEGDRTLAWSGWDGKANRWFVFGPDELEKLRLSYPIGRDTLQAIDRPIYRASGDAFWSKVPVEAQVVAVELGAMPTALPVLVLDKVEVINEVSGDRPVLVAYIPKGSTTSIYEASLDGRRVMMGHSGYFDGDSPILYDRETESFWVAREGEMTAVAGARKGAKLRRIASLASVPWGDWKARYPGGRLLVGAYRGEAPPPD